MFNIFTSPNSFSPNMTITMFMSYVTSQIDDMNKKVQELSAEIDTINETLSNLADTVNNNNVTLTEAVATCNANINQINETLSRLATTENDHYNAQLLVNNDFNTRITALENA